MSPPTPTGLSVYYPFALVELISYVETEDYAQTGEVILAFLDETGCRVTLKLLKPVADALCVRLAAPADKPES